MFGWLRRDKGGSRERLGEVLVAVDEAGWTVTSELERPLFSIALFLYLERLLSVATPRHGELLCTSLQRGVERLMKYEEDEMFPTRHLRNTLYRDWLGDLTERASEPWSLTLTLFRRPDRQWPGGAFYCEETAFSSTDFAGEERLRLLTSSLVTFYEEVFDLDDLEVSHYLMRTLQNLLHLFATNGLPITERLGRATNIATLQYFGLETRSEAVAVAALHAYLAGQPAAASSER